MAHYRYLIVGGGMTGDAAVQGIREADPSAEIGVLSAESHPPYNRPPLSKALWKGEPLESIWRATEAPGVTLHLGRRAVRLDAGSKAVLDDSGATHTYAKLLLATGGEPRRFPFPAPEVIYFRNLDDYHSLRELVDRGLCFGVVGGGFIGSEIAAALRMQGAEVVMILPESGLGARVFPADLSRFLVDYYRQKGVDVRAGEGVRAVAPQEGRVVVRVTHGSDIQVGAVVAGLGIQPSIELARAAGLAVENGVIVDELLRTSDPDVFAAGDVASFYSPALGKRVRVEHEDNANTMGRAAGLAMAGHAAAYRHQPFFYSDLFELGYEAVGDVDAQHETVADWKEPFREGVVYYLEGGRVRGVLLWNVWGQVDAARALIAEPGPFSAAELKGRLPT